MILSSISKNFFNQIAFHISRSISDFLVIYLIAKFSNINNLGLYSFAITFSMTARLLLDLGIGLYLTREISKYKDKVKDYVGNTLTLILIISPIILIIAYLIMYYSTNDIERIHGVMLCMFGLIFVSFSSIFHSVFFAYEKIHLQAITITLQEILFLILVSIILITGLDFNLIFWSYFASKFISFIISTILYILNIGKLSLKFNFDILSKILRDCLPFFINFFFTAIYTRSVILIISFILGNESTGLFEVSLLFSMKVIIISQIISKSVFPKLSRYFIKKNKNLYHSLSFNLIKVSSLISLFFFIIINSFSEIFIKTFFDINIYFKSIDLIKILSFAFFFKVFSTVIADLLTVSLKQKFRSKAIAFGTFANIFSLIILVPIYELNGAALSVVITEVTILFFCIYYSSKNIRKFTIKIILCFLLIIFLSTILTYIFNMNLVYKFIVYTFLFFLISKIFTLFKFSDVNKFINAI